MKNIFKHIDAKEKLNEHFLLLDEFKAFNPAKKLIEEIAAEFEDKDGNFIQQFQTSGFDARMWELFLFKFFKTNEFEILNDVDRPDFHLVKDGFEFFVEASTSNEKKDDVYTKEFITEALENNNIQIQNELIDYYVIRMGSVLFSKLNKKYWELEWMHGKALVFAISPFHDYLAKFLPNSKIIEYLYGLKYNTEITEIGLELKNVEVVEEHKHGVKEIPSNFFSQENAENISAIIFTNNSDLHKFNRIGQELELSTEKISMVRSGLAYNPDPNSTHIEFTHNIIPGKVREDWNESVTMFHNPNAVNPIDHKMFPNIQHVWLNAEGKLDGIMPDFFVYNSITGTMIME